MRNAGTVFTGRELGVEGNCYLILLVSFMKRAIRMCEEKFMPMELTMIPCIDG
jgi:uncharacterized membrane protein (UPF0136 family)